MDVMMSDLMPEEIKEAVEIDPNEGKFAKNPDRVASAKYALGGLFNFLYHQDSARFMVAGTTVVLLLGIILRIPRVEMLLIVLMIGAWWVAELMNTALEAVVDMVTQEYHPLAKVAKDVASGAVLVATVVNAVIIVGILAEPLLEFFGIL
jgi:diacylglycerol kinase (ATP)